jgi:Flp pilus assembly protein TadG
MRQINRNKVTRLRFRSGNAVLDMALVLPLLIGITFGAVEYGYALYIKHSLQSAAREGARSAIVAGAIQQNIIDAVDNSMSAAGFLQSKYTRPPTIEYCKAGTTTWSTAWTSAVAGDSIRVTVTTTWGTAGVSVLPSYLGGISSGKTLTGATTMRKEG